MRTVIGPVCDELGLAMATDSVQGDHGPQLIHRSWATAAGEFRRTGGWSPR